MINLWQQIRIFIPQVGPCLHILSTLVSRNRQRCYLWVLLYSTVINGVMWVCATNIRCEYYKHMSIKTVDHETMCFRSTVFFFRNLCSVNSFDSNKSVSHLLYRIEWAFLQVALDIKLRVISSYDVLRKLVSRLQFVIFLGVYVCVFYKVIHRNYRHF
jgi:hypothetical protein